MALFIDARIPIVFGDCAGDSDAVLTPDPSWETTVHTPGCACCAPRGAVAVALDRLFQARVRGTVPWFDRVVAPRSAEAAVRAAVTADPLTAARFRAP